MAFKLTKNQYLLQRLDGKRRAEIAREQGIKPPAIYPYLSKWSIRDPVAEGKEMKRLEFALKNEEVTREQIQAETHAAPSKNYVTPQSRQQAIREIAATLEPTVDSNLITFHVPIRDRQMPAEMPTNMSRSEAFQFGLTVLQAAVAQTYEDIVDLTGETGDAVEKLHAYVKRQVQQFLSGTTQKN